MNNICSYCYFWRYVEPDDPKTDHGVFLCKNVYSFYYESRVHSEDTCKEFESYDL